VGVVVVGGVCGGCAGVTVVVGGTRFQKNVRDANQKLNIRLSKYHHKSRICDSCADQNLDTLNR
jgi:hypothetical protein